MIVKSESEIRIGFKYSKVCNIKYIKRVDREKETFYEINFKKFHNFANEFISSLLQISVDRAYLNNETYLWIINLRDMITSNPPDFVCVLIKSATESKLRQLLIKTW